MLKYIFAFIAGALILGYFPVSKVWNSLDEYERDDYTEHGTRNPWVELTIVMFIVGSMIEVGLLIISFAIIEILYYY